MKILKKLVLVTLLSGMAGTVLNGMSGSFRDKIARRKATRGTAVRLTRVPGSLVLSGTSRSEILSRGRDLRQEVNSTLFNFFVEIEREQGLTNEIKQQIIKEEIRLNRGRQRSLLEYGGAFSFRINKSDTLFLYSSNIDTSDVDIIIDRIVNYKRGTVLDLSGLTIDSEQLNILIPYIQRLIKEMGLKRLNLGNNKIKSLPKNFRNLNGLLDLDLSKNKLSYGILPGRLKLQPDCSLEKLWRLKTLMALDLSDNNLISVPWKFSKLVNLLLLNLSGNLNLSTFTDSFFNLRKLSCLILRRTYVDDIMRRKLRRMENLNLFF